MTTPIVPGPGGALTAAAQAFGPDVAKVANVGAPALLGDITDQARAIRAWISNRHNWTRVAWFLSGSLMFGVGALMVGQRPAANAVGSVVKTVKG